MNKKLTTKSVEPTNDLDFDFEEFDLDMSSLEPKDDRKPVTRVVSKVVQTAKNKIAKPDFIKDTLRKVLPKDYGATFDMADKLLSPTKIEIRKAAKEIKPTLKEFTNSAKILAPKNEYIQQKIQNIQDWFGINQEYNPRGTSEIREDNVKNILVDVFNEQLQQDRLQSASQALDRGIENVRFKSATKIISSIEKNVSELVQYQNTINANYQKKSLEIQLRSYFISVDTLDQLRKSHVESITELKYITKNTALPEYVKITKTESFKESARNKLINAATGGFFKNSNKIIEEVSENLRNKVNQTLSKALSTFGQVSLGLSAAASAKQSTQNNNEQLDPRERNTRLAENAAEIGSSLAVDNIASKLGKYVNRILSKNKTIGGFAKDLAIFSSDIPANLQKIKNQKTSKIVGGNINDLSLSKKDRLILRGKTGLVNLFKSIIPDIKNDQSLVTDKIDDLNKPDFTPAQTSKSINEIIPGYLSRILREIQIFRTGDDSIKTTTYDFNNNAFSTSEDVIKSIKEKIVSSSDKKNVQSKLDDLINTIDKDNTLSSKEKELLKNKLFRTSVSLQSADKEKFMDKRFYKEKELTQVAEKFSNIFKNFFESADDLQQKQKQLIFSQKMSSIRDTIPNLEKQAQAFINVGQSDLLKESGYVKKTKSGDLKINYDRVMNEYLNNPKKMRLTDVRAVSDFDEKGNIRAQPTSKSLNAIRSIPITKWDYKNTAPVEGKDQIGPMAQAVQNNIGPTASDGKSISLTTMNGYSLSAIQELDKRQTFMLKNLTKDNKNNEDIKNETQDQTKVLQQIKNILLKIIKTDNTSVFASSSTKEQPIESDDKGNKPNATNSNTNSPNTIDSLITGVGKLGGVGRGLLSKVSGVGALFNDKKEEVKDKVTEQTQELKDSAKDKIKQAQTAASQAAQQAKDKIEELTESSKEAIESAKAKGGALKDKAKAAFNDTDADGKRQGSWRDIKMGNKKNKEFDKAKAELPEYENTIDLIARKIGGVKDTIGSIMSGIGGLVGKGGKAGKLAALAGIAGAAMGVPGAGGVADAIDTASDVAGAAQAARGAATTGTTVAQGTAGSVAKKPGLISRAYNSPIGKGLKWAAGKGSMGLIKGAGKVAGTALKYLPRTVGLLGRGAMMVGGSALGAGAAVAGGALGTVLGGAAALMGSPIVVGAGLAYTGYQMYKYLTRNSISDMGKFRYMQYGFDKDDTSHVNKILGLESFLEEKFTAFQKGGQATITKIKPEDAKGMFSLFDVDMENRDQIDKFQTWFQYRFKPVYLQHQTAVFQADKNSKLSKIDSLDPKAKLQYFKAVKMENGPYDITVSPIPDMEYLPSEQAQVMAYYQGYLGKLEKETKEKLDTSSEDFVSTAEGGLAAGAKAAATAASDKAKGIDNKETKPPVNGIFSQAWDNATSFAKETVAKTSSSFRRGFGTNVSNLDSIRFRLYGLTDMDRLKVISLRTMEDKLLDQVKFEGTGAANMSIDANAALEMFKLDFGIASKTDKRATDWKNWFSNRFLKTYLEYISGLKAQLGKVTSDDFGLKNSQALEIATRLVGASSWSVDSSPWLEHVMNTDSSSVDGFLTLIKNKAQNDKIAEEKKDKAKDQIKQNKEGKLNDTTKNNQADKLASPKPSGALPGVDPMYTPKNPTTDEQYGKMKFAAAGSASGNANTSSAPVGTGEKLDKIPAPNGSGLKAVEPTIREAAKATGVKEDTMLAVAAVESGFRPNAVPGGNGMSSSAKGLYQFLDGTWKDVTRAKGSKYDITPQTSPFDARANALMGGEFIKQNTQYMRSVVPEVGPTEAYMAHFLGPAGAKQFFSINKDQPVAPSMPKAAAANAPIFYDHGRPRSKDEIYSLMSNKLKKVSRSYGLNLEINENTPGDSKISASKDIKVAQAATEPPVLKSGGASYGSNIQKNTTPRYSNNVPSKPINQPSTVASETFTPRSKYTPQQLADMKNESRGTPTTTQTTINPNSSLIRGRDVYDNGKLISTGKPAAEIVASTPANNKVDKFESSGIEDFDKPKSSVLDEVYGTSDKPTITSTPVQQAAVAADKNQQVDTGKQKSGDFFGDWLNAAKDDPSWTETSEVKKTEKPSSLKSNNKAKQAPTASASTQKFMAKINANKTQKYSEEEIQEARNNWNEHKFAYSVEQQRDTYPELFESGLVQPYDKTQDPNYEENYKKYKQQQNDKINGFSVTSASSADLNPQPTQEAAKAATPAEDKPMSYEEKLKAATEGITLESNVTSLGKTDEWKKWARENGASEQVINSPGSVSQQAAQAAQPIPTTAVYADTMKPVNEPIPTQAKYSQNKPSTYNQTSYPSKTQPKDILGIGGLLKDVSNAVAPSRAGGYRNNTSYDTPVSYSNTSNTNPFNAIGTLAKAISGPAKSSTISNRMQPNNAPVTYMVSQPTTIPINNPVTAGTAYSAPMVVNTPAPQPVPVVNQQPSIVATAKPNLVAKDTSSINVNQDKEYLSNLITIDSTLTKSLDIQKEILKAVLAISNKAPTPTAGAPAVETTQTNAPQTESINRPSKEAPKFPISMSRTAFA